MISDKLNNAKATVPEERLPEIAELIATGEMPIPNDWPPERTSTLLDLVHVARRHRLVQFIACSIASDIDRSQRSVRKT